MNILILFALFSKTSAANESFFRISYFKNINVISSRSVSVDGEMLKQSYDKLGKLRLEIYSKGKINESLCIDSKKQTHNSRTSNEDYFNCLSEYSQTIHKLGGESEGPSREERGPLDLDFKLKGKDLTQGIKK